MVMMLGNDYRTWLDNLGDDQVGQRCAWSGHTGVIVCHVCRRIMALTSEFC